MAPSRTRTIGFVTAVATGALALRPVEPLEQVLDLALLPGRVLASLALPLGALQAREGPVARAARGVRDEADLEAHRALEARVRRAAWPRRFPLARHAGAVQAEVIGHGDGDLDVLRLAVAEPDRVRPGQPVVAGDAFVGLVARVPGREAPPPAPTGFFARFAARLGLGSGAVRARHDEVLVELVTARDARIGARIDVAEDGAPTRLVVGGLAPRPGAPFLAVHNPERRAVASGTARVYEPEALAGQLGGLAEGFLLGELRREAVAEEGSVATREVLGVRPFLDYEAGLHQVLVLAPDGKQELRPERERTVLGDGGWLPARFFVRAEPSPWREGRKLDRGRQHGVRAGAAVVSGARLAGRVLRAGLVTSDVATLGDVGFVLSVLAEPHAGVPESEHPGLAAVRAGSLPLVLGRIVSLGREADGAVRFRWEPQRPLVEGADPVVGAAPEAPLGLAVTLWTGSGEPGVPRGLLVGDTELPLGPGPHELRVVQAEGARDPRGLTVRIGTRAPGEEEQP